MDNNGKKSKSARFVKLINELKVKGLIRSQAHLADILKENDQKITDIKSGKSSIQGDFITKLFLAFPDLNKNYFESEDQPVFKNQEKRVESNAELVTGRVQRIRIPVIPLDASASFVTPIDAGYKIEEFDFEFDTVEKIPGVRYNTLTVIFKVVGNSMWPRYVHSSKWLCTWVDVSNWRYVEGTHVISTKDGGLLLKRVTKGTNGTLHLKSDNPEYGERTIELSNVLAMWKVQYCTYAPAE